MKEMQQQQGQQRQQQNQKHHHHHSRNSLLPFAVTAIIFFWLGTWLPSGIIIIDNDDDDNVDKTIIITDPKTTTKTTDSTLLLLLKEQKHAQDSFQLLIRQSQEGYRQQPIESHDDNNNNNNNNNVDSELCSRTLTLQVGQDELLSSWIESLEHVARALQVALATERRLVISMEYALLKKCPTKRPATISHDTPTNNNNNNNITTFSMYCFLWRQQQEQNAGSSSCGNHDDGHRTSESTTTTTIVTSPARDGIIIETDTSMTTNTGSDFFNSHFYGPTLDVTLPTWPWKKTWLMDTLDWERRWGSFWVRSQILEYLAIRQLELPAMTGKNTKIDNDDDDYAKKNHQYPSVAILIDEDAHTTLQQSFARNGTKSHSWDRIIGICDWYFAEYYEKYQFYRKSQDSSTTTTTTATTTTTTTLQERDEGVFPTTTIYIATINNNKSKQNNGHRGVLLEAAASSEVYKDHHHHHHQNFTISHSENDNDMTILKNLVNAEVLIGSFASPFFRLAASLNSVAHIGTYPLSQRRIWGLDIEWVPDL